MRCPHCGESIIVTWNPKFTRGDEDDDDELDDEDEEHLFGALESHRAGGPRNHDA